MQNPTADADLNTVLLELVTRQKAILQDNLLACYLQGSFALGDWDAHSDVDFLAVIERDLTDQEVAQLNAMHNRLFDLLPKWSNHLEGSYFPQAILKKEDPQHTQQWFIDNGSRVLQQSTHDNELVVRWQTREYGIALYGADPKTYIDPVPTDDLKRTIRHTMQQWQQEILDGQYRSDNQWAQAFIVLSYCRMLHTLGTGRIHSKPAGVNWAQETLDPKWHGLIQRAWANRPNPSEKLNLRADADDHKQTLAFIHYALRF